MLPAALAVRVGPTSHVGCETPTQIRPWQPAKTRAGACGQWDFEFLPRGGRSRWPFTKHFTIIPSSDLKGNI